MQQLLSAQKLNDNILTVTFFCCNPIWTQLPQFGIHLSDQDIADSVALYRYLSYLLGSPDEYFASSATAKTTMDARVPSVLALPRLPYKYTPLSPFSRLRTSLRYHTLITTP